MVEIDNDLSSHIETAVQWFKEGHSIGLLSESGVPSVADPGSDLISYAHDNNIDVVPLVGPSSIILALSASGLNGQNFSFKGYLPIKDIQLKQELKKLESLVFKSKQTQIFIETPYRNDRMFKTLISMLNPAIRLCIAKDITGGQEFIKCYTIKDWRKKNEFTIGKTPCIFLIG